MHFGIDSVHQSSKGSLDGMQLSLADTLTPALGVYCIAALLANTCMGISGFGSGIILVLGWEVANILELDGVVPFVSVIRLSAAVALPIPAVVRSKCTALPVVSSRLSHLPVCCVA